MAGDSTTIARPYAEASFAVAKAQQRLDAWSEALALLAAIVTDAQVSARVNSPNVPRAQMRDLLFGIAGEGLPVEVQNLVRLLSDNRRLSVLPEIARLFEERRIAEQGLRRVQVRSAFPISAADQGALAATLKQHFGAEVELTIVDDPELIGGVVIRADDMVIDGSIRGRLQQLSNELQF